MKKKLCIVILLLLNIYVQERSYAQEEESAEIFLEDYTDLFQEMFFEALKQKGIENYDRAIIALLKCKQIEPESDAVDYELAITYQLNKQFMLAEQFALEALLKQPENYWYLHAWLDIKDMSIGDLTILKSQLPYKNTKLKENMALIFFKMQKYESAIEVLKDLNSSNFKKELNAKIKDSLSIAEIEVKEITAVENNQPPNPVTKLIDEVDLLIVQGDLIRLNEKIEEALEIYPSQPYFYWAKGFSLNKNQEYKAASEFLEMGLDLFVEGDLGNKFYNELVIAYTGLKNEEKANFYRTKLKNGS